MRLAVSVAGLCVVALTLGSCDPSAPGEGETQVVVLNQDVSAASLVPWDHVEIVSEREVVVHYSAGDERCSIPERVVIKFEKDRISLGVYEGQPMDAEDVPCLDQAVAKTLEVELEHAIEDRNLVRGR